MKTIYITRAITTVGLTWYVPAPSRGNVASLKAVYNLESDLDETITLSRDTTAVNVATPPADTTAAGVSFAGVPSANKALIFDPASATAANRVIKIVIPGTIDATVTVGLTIEFDDSAFVEQAASEA